MDTLGAGDTFVAATILRLSLGFSLQHSITYGCQVAGQKCGMRGFTGLQTTHNPCPTVEEGVLGPRIEELYMAAQNGTT